MAIIVLAFVLMGIGTLAAAALAAMFAFIEAGRHEDNERH